MNALQKIRYLSKKGIFSQKSPLAGLIIEELKRAWNSQEVDHGFSYDLNKSFEIPHPRINLRLRELKPTDLETLFDFQKQKYSSGEFKNALQCLLFANSKIPTGYVGVTDKDIPCVMTWLILSTENERLQEYFSGGLPPLDPDEALCEFVYTHPNFRGLGLMGWITKNLWKIAKEKGANRVTVLVHGTNTVSQKMTPKLGFIPVCKKTTHRRFFKKQITFEEIHSSESVNNKTID